MTTSLWFELNDLRLTYEKLFSQERKLHTEHIKDVKDFLNNSVFDSEWEEYLVKTACNLASSELRLKIAFSKYGKIRKSLIDEEKKK